MSPDVPFDVTGRRVLVTGLTPAGFAAADALLEHGARVAVLRRPAGSAAEVERAEILQALGADLLTLAEPPRLPVEDGSTPFDLVVLGAGEDVDRRLLADGDLSVPVWTEAEVAWRLRPAVTPWLVVGGGARRRAVTELCARILRAAGQPVVVAGGDDRPVVEALRVEGPPPVVVVDLSAWQARHNGGVGAFASAWLTSDDASPPRGGDLTRAAEAVYEGTVSACLYPAEDPLAETALREADVVEGCRAVAVGTGVPPVAALGLVEDVLCDRAFHPQRQTAAVELAGLDDVAACFAGLDGPSVVTWVLLAAGLARAVGAPPAAVRAALRDGGEPPVAAPQVLGRDDAGTVWVLDPHALTPAGACGAVRGAGLVWVVAARALTTQAPLPDAVRARLRGVLVVIEPGSDPERAGAEVARHAPEVPVRTLPRADTDEVSDVDDRCRARLQAWAAAAVEVAADLAGRGGAVVWTGHAPAAAGGPVTSWSGLGAAFAAAAATRLGQGR